MRVSLFHNQNAGDSTSLSWISELIETSGHQLVRVDDQEAVSGELIDWRTELVVAAGGDGTVAAVARLVAGRSIPLAVLPLGTANNIAKAVQAEASNEQLVAGWETVTRRRFDLGVVRGPWGERRFLEAVGIGLVPMTIASIHTSPFNANDVTSKLARATIRYCHTLSHLEPLRSTLVVDGQELTDDFIVAEVMNIRSLGPNLVLAPDADPSDGSLCVVTATEKHRDDIAAYLQDRIEGREGALSLPAVRAHEVEIRSHADAHIDDEVVRSPIPEAMSIRIEGAIDILVPDVY